MVLYVSEVNFSIVYISLCMAKDNHEYYPLQYMSKVHRLYDR